MDATEREINRAALAFYYTEGSYDLKNDYGNEIGAAGYLLAKYRETDGTIYGQDEK